MSESIEGILGKDRPHGWIGHYKLDGKWIMWWIKDRLESLPDGAYVKISIEVLDPHPVKEG